MQFKKISYMVCALMAGNGKYCLWLDKKNQFVFFITTLCITLFLIAGFLINTTPQEFQGQAQSTTHAVAGNGGATSKQTFFESDKELYKQIFRAQKSANWDLANANITKLSDRILLGDVLAERYLDPAYDTSSAEIIVWLKNYSDHLASNEIIELAKSKYPDVFSNIPETQKSSKLQGYGDGNSEDIRFDDNVAAKKLWIAGIEAWRANKKHEATNYFSALADKQKNLSDWQYSAANFWAYRTFLESGDKDKAGNYLSRAASNPRVFYGILARKKLNKSLELDTENITQNTSEIKKYLNKEKIQRIVALAEYGLNERAEAQIRMLFPSANKQEKWFLLSLADKLGLASVQISMAKQLETADRKLDFLKYPIPKWQPNGGFNLEPDLLYALIRQESGFHSSATSPVGALGLMQLMPQTAKKMHVQISNVASSPENFREPILNLTLGERYVEHLLNNSLVDGNLLYMLAAYNAGPKRLKEWQKNINYNDDPLLFIESIPYSETRTHILQVMTNYWIYLELNGKQSRSVTALLQGKWPTYQPVATSVADSGKRLRAW